MAKLEWDKTAERIYETGVSHGVLYVRDEMGKYPKGVAWNGLTAVNETASGGEPSPFYADNIKYLELSSNEEFGATIEAFTYPKEFEACEGVVEAAAGVNVTQQDRKSFGFSYQTIIGNDVKGNAYGYKLHLVYGAKAAPSEKNRATINDSPEPVTFSWSVTTTPEKIEGYKPTAHIVINSITADPEQLKALEDKLYGSSAEATLPSPDEVIKMFAPAA